MLSITRLLAQLKCVKRVKCFQPLTLFLRWELVTWPCNQFSIAISIALQKGQGVDKLTCEGSFTIEPKGQHHATFNAPNSFRPWICDFYLTILCYHKLYCCCLKRISQNLPELFFICQWSLIHTFRNKSCTICG